MQKADLDWGVVTPEAYDDVTKEALHVLNVLFVGEMNRTRAIKFTSARVLHFHRHLPQGSSQRVRFDLRGQLISNKNLEMARQTIVEQAQQKGIPVSVEFLTN